MIMRGPGIPKGVRIDTPVENVDLFPTLMDLCKLNVSDGLQGRSLTEAMANGDTERKNVFSSILQCRSVRTMPDGYKLVLPLKRLKLRRVELYDTIADPGELYNIAEDHPEVVTRLTKLINDWVKRYPVKTTLGRKKSKQNLADLEALGYATGQDDEDSD
jgi:arylsulfatase A-like enzyme